MINIQFDIGLPIKVCKQKTYLYKEAKISKNKFISIQIDRSEKLNLFGFGIAWYPKTSHAGIMLEFTLLSQFIIVEFADTRHWYYEKDRYFLPGEEEALYGN